MPLMNLASQKRDALREKLEAALRAADFEPETTDRGDLERRWEEIRMELATLSADRISPSMEASVVECAANITPQAVHWLWRGPYTAGNDFDFRWASWPRKIDDHRIYCCASL